MMNSTLFFVIMHMNTLGSFFVVGQPLIPLNKTAKQNIKLQELFRSHSSGYLTLKLHL